MSWLKISKRRLREHRISVAIVFLVGIVALIAWSRLIVDEERSRFGAAPAVDADYTLEDFTWTLVNAQGELDLRVSAQAMQHQSKTERARFIAPRFTLFEAGKARWQGRAKTGWADDIRREIKLQGAVLIERSQDAPMGSLTLDTEKLRVYPDAERIVSEVDVTLTQPGARLQGTGMALNLAEETYMFKADVTGRYALPDS